MSFEWGQLVIFYVCGWTTLKKGATRSSHTSAAVSQSTCRRSSGISTVGGANRLFPGLSEVRIAVGSRYFSITQESRPGFGAHPASYTVSTGVFSPGVKRAKSKHSHLHLVTSLRMSAAVFQLLLDIFVALTGGTLLVHYVAS